MILLSNKNMKYINDIFDIIQQEQAHHHVYPIHVPMAESVYQTLVKKPTSAGVHKASKEPTAKKVSLLTSMPICNIAII